MGRIFLITAALLNLGLFAHLAYSLAEFGSPRFVVGQYAFVAGAFLLLAIWVGVRPGRVGAMLLSVMSLLSLGLHFFTMTPLGPELEELLAVAAAALAIVGLATTLIRQSRRLTSRCS